MNLDLNFFALDLEMAQPSNKIIQIGIAIGNAQTEHQDFVLRQWMIDPEEPITPFITQLTGISDDDIAQQAVPWAQFCEELRGVLERHPCFPNPVTWGGGDVALLQAALREQNLETPIRGHRWIDVKTFHTFSCLARGKSAAGGLASIMQKYKVKFEGTPHRADTDAMNTLRLFFKLMHRQATLEGAADALKTI